MCSRIPLVWCWLEGTFACICYVFIEVIVEDPGLEIEVEDPGDLGPEIGIVGPGHYQ